MPTATRKTPTSVTRHIPIRIPAPATLVIRQRGTFYPRDTEDIFDPRMTRPAGES
jgi:hypothetical protein